MPVADDQIIESTPNLVTWRTTSFVSALRTAKATEQFVAVVHSHPANVPQFSAQDDANEPDLVQLAVNRNGPGSRILSLILTADGILNGRVWLTPQAYSPLRILRVIGSSIKLHYPERDSGKRIDAFQRQALAFGQALNNDLRTLRVTVVGCGGTGSATATLLARLGVGQLALIDNDIVDVSNLNRLHGARRSDADAMRPKVEVVARSITELGLGTRVVPIEAWVGDPTCRDALRASDVIFGCTDDDEGRLFLNRFAYYYLTPVIDMGLAIDVARGEPPRIQTLDGRVTVLGPNHTCLVCRDVVSSERARVEVMRRKDPESYERLKAEAYVTGEGDPNPAVVTFTTELASMGINELLHRMQGFRGENGQAANRVRKFHLMEDRRPGHKPQPSCAICAREEVWGRGDTGPFLDRLE